MDIFHKASHLSEILDLSKKEPVIIFKHSETCAQSTHTYVELEKRIMDKRISVPVYLVIVQAEPGLSRDIEESFGIKHESPQVILVEDGEVTYVENHLTIDPDRLSTN